MPISYLTPGIYVEETPPGNRPIEALGTSTAAFVGIAPLATGRVNEAVAIDSWEQFKKFYIFGEERYGGAGDSPPPDVKTTPLAQAVRGFFDNEGSRCFVVNLGPGGALQGTGGARRQGIDILEEVDEVAIVCAPGFHDAQSYQALTTHCEKMKDRVAILDCPEDVPDLEMLKELALPPASPAPAAAPGETPARRAGTTERRAGMLSTQSSYAAYYCPWVTCVNAVNPAAKVVNAPPCGHVAGMYARTDRMRGVHKAPANEDLRVLNVVYNVTDAEQGGLNEKGVNVIRRFTGNGIRVWGARTRDASSSPFRYINVRRTFAMLEESIVKGTSWVVFEPNDRLLWRRLRVSVAAFLRRLWTSGALVGRTPEEAYFVKCDEETNPPEVVDAGQIVAIIGVAVVKPAEFVIFRFAQETPGMKTGEAANG